MKKSKKCIILLKSTQVDESNTMYNFKFVLVFIVITAFAQKEGQYHV